MPAAVRALTRDDLPRIAATASWVDAAICRERLAWQDDGVCLQLVAWTEGEYAGRATLLWESKYPAVRWKLPDAAEVNALHARPTGLGTGTAMMMSAEEAARERGAPLLGLAVAPSNVGALRFYDRLGYREWDHGTVVDEYTETDADGAFVQHHADVCRYLTKALT